LAKGISLGGKKLFAVVVVLALVAGGAGYAFLGGGSLPFLNWGENRGEEEKPAQAQAEAAQLHQMALDSLVVNLADAGGRRYLRVTITLEYSDPRVEKELERTGYKIRDAVIRVLRSKTAADLSPDKTEPLKTELIDTVNGYLNSGRITGLYFQEFIIQ
jgi:flagellar FliL protein